MSILLSLELRHGDYVTYPTVHLPLDEDDDVMEDDDELCALGVAQLRAMTGMAPPDYAFVDTWDSSDGFAPEEVDPPFVSIHYTVAEIVKAGLTASEFQQIVTEFANQLLSKKGE